MIRRTLLALALLATTAALGQAVDYKDIKTPPMKAFNPPVPKRIQLSNGLVIFLMEDHELPLIRTHATIRGGGRNVPADKAGLASIYGASWRTGGTATQSGDQLDEILAGRAAKLETSGGGDSTSISFDILKGDLDFVFPIFLDLLRGPQFRQEKIDLAKTQMNTGISRRNDSPDSILHRETEKLGYGENSPYTHQPEYASVASITRDDLLAFHKRFMQPNNIIIGVVGDFDSAAMEKRLRQAFGSWPRGPQAPPAPPNGTPAKNGVYFVAKDDVTQSNIAFVGPGILRRNPDFFAVRVLNEILDGGSFSGRLINEIRTKRGLAYSAGGSVFSNWDHQGLFIAQMGTKSGSTVEAITAMQQALRDAQSQPFTDEEVNSAKDRILNAFVFTMDSRDKILGEQLNLEFYGFPLDYYRNYPANVQKVTAADVAAAAKKYIPQPYSILVVGKEKDLDKPLSTLGTVSTIDVAIPELGAKQGAKPAAAPGASTDEGRALLEKVRTFVGGKEKIAAVKTTHTVASINARTPQGDMALDVDATTTFPDREHRTMKMPMGEMTMVMTPEASFMLTPMGAQDMPGSQHDRLARDLKLELLPVLIAADQPGYTFTVTGSEKVGDIDTNVLAINAGGLSAKWWIDPATGRVLRKGVADTLTDYSDWKTFAGLNLPSKFSAARNGEVVGSGELKSLEINPVVDPKIWEKPK